MFVTYATCVCDMRVRVLFGRIISQIVNEIYFAQDVYEGLASTTADELGLHHYFDSSRITRATSAPCIALASSVKCTPSTPSMVSWLLFITNA